MQKNSPKIFLLEDNKDLGQSLTAKFAESGYESSWCINLTEAKKHTGFSDIDLFILDVGLPDGTGFEFAQWLQDNNYKQPIVFLTAMGSPEDRLKGYELGAEEYIPKPFLYKELELRINHVLENHSKNLIYEFEDLTIDFESMTFKWKNGEIVFPQTKDLQILKILIQKSPQVIARDEILNQVWGIDDFPSERTVDNSIVRLRQSLKDYQGYLKSVRGMGYQWLVS
jgi:two-component system, OmpR family, phosphate regulon response regulator PhoB